ncbi:MAG: AMP-binding protein [Deltaproteobacteria bacterium]|nr:AMP-binding protein [Deltaproteobacteria bacterium]MBW2725122.1 AMP-binding protein [Deltaproteobacteria bacterium]
MRCGYSCAVPIRVTNDEIQRRANRFARALDAAGVPTRAVVAVLLPNVAEFVHCLRGATWSGRTFTPVNCHLSPKEIAYIVDHCEARALVVHAQFADFAQSLAPGIPHEARFAVAGDLPGFRPFEEIDGFSDDDLEHPLAGTLMLYTSGTTGTPKGVKTDVPSDEPPPCLSSRMGSAMLSTYLNDDAAGSHLVVAPLYHAGPSTYGEGAALLGAEVIIMEHWDAEEFLRIVDAEKITSTFLVPTHFVRLLQLPEATRARYDVSSLKLVCHGAAPVSPDVKRRMIEWLGPVLFEFYGGTEGGGVSIDSHDWLTHPGSVGRPRPGLEVHILDSDGKILNAGETGDVYFKSAGAGFEYKDDPEKTASAYRGDMYTLGDIGYLDGEGFLYLCDRKADTIISGGVNIYPAQIEAVLLEHPEVHDCCVVGVLDEEWGERVLAVIQPGREDANTVVLTAELEQLCRDQLGRQQWPREYAFTQSLPRTETGKLLRREVRDQYRTHAAAPKNA